MRVLRRTHPLGTASKGYLHCGPTGAGHFVKMVHNGIEYGVMAAYAEGLNVLKAANVGKGDREVDAETTPLSNPEYYQFDIDLAAVTEVWRHGSVIGSWLLDLTAAALKENPSLEGFDGRVSDSGRRPLDIAGGDRHQCTGAVLSSALFDRFVLTRRGRIRRQGSFAMRYAFGGHLEKS